MLRYPFRRLGNEAVVETGQGLERQASHQLSWPRSLRALSYAYREYKIRACLFVHQAMLIYSCFLGQLQNCHHFDPQF